MALLVAVVATGSAIAVNLATDLKHSVWAWVAVALLAVAGAGATEWTRALGNPAATVGGSRLPKEAHTTHNEISGQVTGPVVQAGDISGSVTMTDRSRSVNQTAIGFGDSVIQQAGGDIHNGGEPRPRL
jgi:hypothetical protein